VSLNQFTPGVPGLPCGVLQILPPPLGSGLCTALNPSQLLGALGVPGTKNLQRCPGANERGLSDEQLTLGGTVNCDPNEKPVGP
jgi:hypothetical protein